DLDVAHRCSSLVAGLVEYGLRVAQVVALAEGEGAWARPVKSAQGVAASVTCLRRPGADVVPAACCRGRRGQRGADGRVGLVDHHVAQLALVRGVVRGVGSRSLDGMGTLAKSGRRGEAPGAAC